MTGRQGRAQSYLVLSWVLLLPDVRDVAVVTEAGQVVATAHRLGRVADRVPVVERHPRSVVHGQLVGLRPEVSGLVDRRGREGLVGEVVDLRVVVTAVVGRALGEQPAVEQRDEERPRRVAGPV